MVHPSEVDWGQMGSTNQNIFLKIFMFTLSIPIVSFLLNGILKILFSDVTNWKLYSLSSAFVLPAVSTVAKFSYFSKFQKFKILEFSNDISTYPCYVFSDPWTCYTATKSFDTGGFHSYYNLWRMEGSLS